MSKSKVRKQQILEELHIGMAVRNTVRNMAYNLENVITNLHGIVGDLHVLVTQIDSVADKIDRPTKNGYKKPENGLRYMLTPINGSSESVSSKGVVSNNIQHWQDLIETCENQEFSPDLDWSYLGLSGDSKPTSFQLPSNPKLRRSVSSESVASASLLEQFQITTTTDLNAHTICSLNAVPYDGSYERAVDDVLENMGGEDEESDFSDAETSSDSLTASFTSSTQSNESSVSSIEYQAVYNRHTNPWKCYSSVVNPLEPLDKSTGTLDSKDSFNVDDILNDNYLESKYFSHRLEDNISNAVIFNQ